MTQPVFDPSRSYVATPDDTYRYQLAEKDGQEIENLFTVWRHDDGRWWSPESMIYVDDEGTEWSLESMIYVDEDGEPGEVGHPIGAPDGPPIEAYMRAAGHIWAAFRAGLWNEIWAAHRAATLETE